MAGTIARRHPDRARAFCILFSNRHLHRPKHSAQLAIVDLSPLGGSASPEDDGEKFAEGAIFPAPWAE